MKYIIILGDGMADEPLEILGGKTPLEVANKPCTDNLVKNGILGMVQTVPAGFPAGSDVANLSVLGFAPQKFYTGRSPLEAASIGVELGDNDVTLRANLVALSDETEYENATMIDYSSGEISTSEAKILIEFLQKNLTLPPDMKLFCGTSYRHCLRVKNAETGKNIFTPPHDISGKKIADYLPKGENSDMFLRIMKTSKELLQNHEINQKRKSDGKNIANSLWFWGEGSKPKIPSFEEKYGLKGAAISAVDLIKGIAKLSQMQVIDVEGATGTINTNFDGKCQAAIEALKTNDFVFIHIEAPDECGHQGDLEGKIKSIELIDQKIIKPIFEHFSNSGQDFSMLILPDHRTPIAKRTHTKDPVPFVIYRTSHIAYRKSKDESKITNWLARTLLEQEPCEATNVQITNEDKIINEFDQQYAICDMRYAINPPSILYPQIYCEKDAEASGIFYPSGEKLIIDFFRN